MRSIRAIWDGFFGKPRSVPTEVPLMPPGTQEEKIKAASDAIREMTQQTKAMADKTEAEVKKALDIIQIARANQGKDGKKQ